MEAFSKPHRKRIYIDTVEGGRRRARKDPGYRGVLVGGVNEGHETNLIFRLLQLSQARCVFVLFLASACAAALADAARAESLIESVGSALVGCGMHYNSRKRYFLFRLPVVGVVEGGGEGSADGCSACAPWLGPAAPYITIDGYCA